jgi:hypothetical protein
MFDDEIKELMCWNDEIMELMCWIDEIKDFDRIKASKLMRIQDRMKFMRNMFIIRNFSIKL